MMSMSDIGSGIAGVFGANEKAKLIIYKDVESGMSQGSIADAARGALASAASSSVSGLTGALNGLTGDILGGDFNVMQVQFNPASIHFDANSVPVPAQYLQTYLDATIPNSQSRKESISMSVDLTFDAVSNKDAFHGDKFRISASDVAAAVGTLVKEAMGGYTVQPQTNGLVAAMLRESTRVISFVWAKMTFTGILEEVQAKYTMFSVSGKPIRSVVTMRLQQMMTGGDSKVWDESFTKFFGQGDGKSMIAGKSKLQEMQSLLNLGGF